MAIGVVASHIPEMVLFTADGTEMFSASARIAATAPRMIGFVKIFFSTDFKFARPPRKYSSTMTAKKLYSGTTNMISAAVTDTQPLP